MGGNRDALETLYRGESSGNRGPFGAGRHYTPDKEWARQFTQSGQAHEVKSAAIRAADIYTPKELAYAGDAAAMDAAIAEAKRRGYKAVRLSEGQGEPSSVFVFDKAALRANEKGATPLKMLGLTGAASGGALTAALLHQSKRKP